MRVNRLCRALIAATAVLSITALSAPAASAIPSERGYQSGPQQMRDVWCC